MENKISFIAELLNSKNIEASQKERILLMTKKELDLIGDSNEIFNIKISALEKKIHAIQSSSANSISEHEIYLKIDEYLIKKNKMNEFDDGPLEDMSNHAIGTDEAMIQQHIDAEEAMIEAAIEQQEAEKAMIQQLIKAEEEMNESLIDRLSLKNSSIDKFPSAKSIQKKSEVYMSPKDLKDFLIEFNQNDILKYTCHLIDGDALIKINASTKTDEYDFQKHLKIINKAFYNIINKYKEKINKNIHGLIGEYLNNYSKSGWSSDKIKITWSSPELLEWAKINPGKCPNPDPTLNSIPFNFQPFKINNQQTRVQNFDDIVLHFKSLFHIRRDNSLKASIDLVNNNYFSKIDDIDSSNIRENIEFFTDIDKVKQAYKKIIEMCNEFHNKVNPSVKPVFRLSLIEDNDTIIFSIHHKNSIFGKTSINTITRQGEKTSKLIENLINGVCDLHLKADFGHEDYAEINLWNGMKKEIKKIEFFEGVQFDLIFYR